MSTTGLKYVSKLSKARILIIGGTSGIGFCVAEACLENGASVILAGSKQTKLSNAISRLQTRYPDLSTLVSGRTCDLSDPDSIEANLETLLEAATTSASTPLNHIVFTAGDALNLVPLSAATVDTIHATGTIRFLAPLLLAKLAPTYLVPGPASSITLTSGTNSAKPMPGWTVQAAYGAGMEGLTRGLAVDLKPVRVNLVSPGAVHTELFNDFGGENLEAFLKRMREGTLTGEVGKPEDVAEAYLYFMRDRFVTGSMVSSDGGRLLV
ncbi:hypothetical protein MMC16_006316 [Acarospora aff. strigata]|nr:hypothetical protein [Acarospora aff. strigata]